MAFLPSLRLLCSSINSAARAAGGDLILAFAWHTFFCYPGGCRRFLEEDSKRRISRVISGMPARVMRSLLMASLIANHKRSGASLGGVEQPVPAGGVPAGRTALPASACCNLSLLPSVLHCAASPLLACGIGILFLVGKLLASVAFRNITTILLPSAVTSASKHPLWRAAPLTICAACDLCAALRA